MRDWRLTEAEPGTVGPSWGRPRCQPSRVTRLLRPDPLRLSPRDSHRRGKSWVQTRCLPRTFATFHWVLPAAAQPLTCVNSLTDPASWAPLLFLFCRHRESKGPARGRPAVSPKARI